MELHEEILELFRKRMVSEATSFEYINPHFMQEIVTSIYDYYEVDDDEVDQWILDMFGA